MKFDCVQDDKARLLTEDDTLSMPKTQSTGSPLLNLLSEYITKRALIENKTT